MENVETFCFILKFHENAKNKSIRELFELVLIYIYPNKIVGLEQRSFSQTEQKIESFQLSK